MAKSVYIAFLPLEAKMMKVLLESAERSHFAPSICNLVSDRGRTYTVFSKSWSPVDHPEPALGIAKTLVRDLRVFAPEADVKVLVEDTDVDVYINTDESGEFFDNRVWVEYYLPNVPGASDYFTCESEARAIGMVNDFLTANIRESASTLDEAAAIAEKWGGWIRYGFYTYEI
jgi:hypothetical protein